MVNAKHHALLEKAYQNARVTGLKKFNKLRPRLVSIKTHSGRNPTRNRRSTVTPLQQRQDDSPPSDLVLVYKGAKDKHIPTGGRRWKEGRNGMGWKRGGVRFRLELEERRGESTGREIVLAKQGEHKLRREAINFGPETMTNMEMNHLKSCKLPGKKRTGL